MTVETFILEDHPIPMLSNTPSQSNPPGLPPMRSKSTDIVVVVLKKVLFWIF